MQQLERREQHYLSAVVNFGLALAVDADAYTVGLYWAERGVPAKVASRVLSKRAKRRGGK